ncbi:MAG: RdgB/HAM1 family non-canonical purine NTP pyrophosphatase [Campylobacterales bacterium]|nr:RdgB/HAM1 family non-canonical purine NTP pyrophosphatase [Campylobacterales bacterium]
MKIILASSNKGKIKEIQGLLPEHQVIPFSDILGKYDIEEYGSTFQENAIIKAKDVNEKLKNINFQIPYIVISDDSGLSVEALNGDPGIYSARYAGIGATDSLNNQLLINNLKKLGLKSSEAFYTASICVIYKDQVYTTHGWMYGKVVDYQKGSGGFGYDPMFIPNGFTKTLGELEYKVKKSFSHRTKALDLAMILLNSIMKR